MGTQRVKRVIDAVDFVSPALFTAASLRAANATALIARDGNPATAFLIAEDLAITNHHVFSSADDAANVTIRFNYQSDADGKLMPVEDQPFEPERYFYTKEHLDYSIVAVGGDPGRRWGYFELAEAVEVDVGDDVFVVQHPRGEPKQLVASGNTVSAVEGNFVRYTADTEIGSSGSPVFDRNWHLAALHHWGDRTFNEGVRASAIAADWPGR